MPPGRNDPCPCGSGKKYKKCHGNPLTLVSPTAPSTRADPDVARADALKKLDKKLEARIMAFMQARVVPQWFVNGLDTYAGGDAEMLEDAEMQLAVPWVLYHYVGGDWPDSMARRMRDEPAGPLSQDLRRVLDAQLDAWLSMWEVLSVEHDRGMQLRDVLTGEAAYVFDKLASQGLVVRDTVLARVVTLDGVAYFSGMHPHSVGPSDVAVIVDAMRRACRVKVKPIAAAKLRDVKMQLRLIDYWSDVFARRAAAGPPTMTNTDGDLLSLTTDHFDFAAKDRAQIIRALSNIGGADVDGETHGVMNIAISRAGNAMMKSWDNTQIGMIAVKATRFTVETNSVKRADELRLIVERALGVMVRHRLRDEDNPTAMLMDALSKRDSNSPPIGSGKQGTPEMTEIARKLRQAYMEDWVDQSIPALDGATPREALRSDVLRGRLELMLREMEREEARRPVEERIDIGRIRDLLGM